MAQITTGNVAGTVKDAQGGVVPGATVVLVSETKGTKSAPAVTNETGDYIFPNVTPDTYTVEVTMEGFKTAEARAHRRSAAATASPSAPLTLEVGGAAETVNVTAEAALVQSQSGERSFAITTEQVENLPIDHGNFTSLTAFTPGVSAAARRPAARASAASSQNNIMMDGVSAMDTGNNGQMINMNIESIGEVKVLTQGYQAEYGRSSGLQITAVTKSGTNQFRGSRLRRHAPTPTGTRTAGSTRRTATPKPRLERRPRLHHRRSGRQAGRHQQAVLLLRARVPPDDQPRSTTATRSGFASRPRSSAPGDFSQTLDNNGAPFNFVSSLDPVPAAAQAACSRTTASSQDSGGPPVSARASPS